MLDALFSGPGLIAIVLLWTYALWHASRAVVTREAKTSTRRPRGRSIEQVSLSSPIFYLGNLLILTGLVMRLMFREDLFRPYGVICILIGYALVIPLLWYCEFNTVVDPKLIHLSIKHELKTDQAYEAVRHWVPAVWYFEKPVMILFSAIFVGLGVLLMYQYNQREYLWISGFGVQFFLLLRSFCKITTLILRPQRITLRRWLADPEEIELPVDEIQELDLWQNSVHRFFKASGLEVIDTDGQPAFGMVLKKAEADQIHDFYHEQIAQRQEAQPEPDQA